MTTFFSHTQWAASLHAHLDRVAAVLPALHVARSQFARVQHAVARAHVGMQALLLVTGLETLAEAAVILVFHVVGTVMELF
jgi:uncharacterized membrane protein YoaT (DUF817 family)